MNCLNYTQIISHHTSQSHHIASETSDTWVLLPAFHMIGWLCLNILSVINPFLESPWAERGHLSHVSSLTLERKAPSHCLHLDDARPPSAERQSLSLLGPEWGHMISFRDSNGSGGQTGPSPGWMLLDQSRLNESVVEWRVSAIDFVLFLAICLLSIGYAEQNIVVAWMDWRRKCIFLFFCFVFLFILWERTAESIVAGTERCTGFGGIFRDSVFTENCW